MSTHAVMERPIHAGMSADILDEEIVRYLDEEDVVSLDALVSLLPQYSWNQIFSAVDRLARRGTIVLRRHRFSYTLFSRRFAS
ncbi:MAG TPA: hypothetical protein VJ746_18095 [Nitrospira sp.]|nr:hypothetical protein [Nitrospira sp.]